MMEEKEHLKSIWYEITNELNKDNFKKVEEIIRYYNHENSSVSVLRMVLDVVKTVKDIKPFDELFKSIKDKIELRIGKIY